MLDLKEQLKNDSRIRLIEKVTAVESSQSFLSDHIVDLDRENNKLKSIVGELRKSMGLLQAKLHKSVATVRAEANPATKVNKTTASTTGHDNKDPPSPPASTLSVHQLRYLIYPVVWLTKASVLCAGRWAPL